jgi:AcrR family transcriptional regulator
VVTDDPVWDRPEPTERRVPTPLSRERIVRAAVTLADAEGLDAVSLRKVAAALDAGPMRLYRYAGTKDELLALMVDAVYAEIPLPAGPTWQDVLRSIAHGIRQAALEHEWFADLRGSRPQFGPATLTHTEASLAALRATPEFPDPSSVMRALDALSSYVTGAVRREVTSRRAERSTGLDEPGWQRSNGPYLTRMFATGNYPALAEVVHDAEHLDSATTFELGLDYLLAGIEAHLR